MRGARPRRFRRAFPQSLCLLFLGLSLAVAGFCSPVVSGASGKSPCCAGTFATSGCFAAGLHYDEVNRGSIAHDKSSNVAFGYERSAMLAANEHWKHSADTPTSLVEIAEFLAAERGASGGMRIPQRPWRYGLSDQSGSVFPKWSASDCGAGSLPNLIRRPAVSGLCVFREIAF